VRRPQDQEKENAEEEEGKEGGMSRGNGGHFEGGMGGRVRGGEWQVEMPAMTRDPRDIARAASHAAADASAFETVGRTFDGTLDEYPALAPGGAASISNWGKLNNDKSKKQDFPALGGVSGGPKVVGTRSFSEKAIGKVTGGGAGSSTEDLWSLNIKKDKRLRPAGVSMAKGGKSKGEGAIALSFKGAVDSPLSLAVRLHR
jgi:hypothetical protein